MDWVGPEQAHEGLADAELLAAMRAGSSAAGPNRIDIGHYGPERCLTGFLGRQRGTLPMPWKETCVMDEKTAFIADVCEGSCR